LYDRALATIQKYQMLDKGDHVLVAVSGGPDSVALLYFLAHIAEVYDLTLIAFHLDHEIRGAAAQEDARFVEELAYKLQVPVIIRAVDVPALAQQEKRSLEEAAREARYRLMDELAAEQQCNRVALGHHADDQVETFLMRLVRGAGLDGLRAMLPVRGRYIRPFIELTKDEILAFLEENNLPYRTDASNEDTSILRNKLRHELIPLLESYNPRFKGSILTTIEVVRADHTHLDELTERIFGELGEFEDNTVRVPVQGVLAQAVSIRRRLIRRCIRQVKGDLYGIEFKHIEAIINGLESAPARIEVELPGNIIIFSEYEWLVCAPRDMYAPPRVVPILLEVPGTNKIDELDIVIDARYETPAELVFGQNGGIAHLDADTLPGTLRVRTRKPGDTFRPLGMTGEKKLQDFFVDEKVPRRKRDNVPIVAADDTIVWVAGFRIDERFKVTADTRRVLTLKLRPKD
jgi:tRNA(Ile)-lysidine synthase